MAKKPLRISDDVNDLQTVQMGPTELAGIGGLDVGDLGTHIIERNADDLTFKDVKAGGPYTLQELLGIGAGVGVGSIFSFALIKNGNLNNGWFKYVGQGINNDQVPLISPFTCEIFAWGYSNAVNNTSSDIEIYKNGTNNASKVDTVLIRNSRKAWGSLAIPIAYAPGDSIHVKASNAGTTPSDPVFVLWFKVTNSTIGSGSSVLL